jgi:hypothetical protein
MERKKRSYTKPPPSRKYNLVLIIAEGKREDGYFKKLKERKTNIQIEIIHREDGVSSPKYAFDRLNDFKLDTDWNQLDGDEVWFVFDIDNWGTQLTELIDACQKESNHYTAISNPCFEVWLHYHSNETLQPMNAQELKTHLPKQPLGQYSAVTFVSNITVAITNAKAADTNPDADIPELMQTKVYKLAQRLIH